MDKPFIPAHMADAYAQLRSTQVLPPSRNYLSYEDALEKYQEDHGMDLPRIRTFHQHYKTGEVVRVEAIVRADAFENPNLGLNFVIVYRNLLGELYYTNADRFAELVMISSVPESVEIPKRRPVKKPFEWTYLYSMFRNHIEWWRRWRSQVYTYNQVMKELDRKTNDPLYVINNMGRYHATGNVDLIIPHYRSYDQGAGVREDQAITIPSGWLPIDITQQATRESLAANRYFKEMLAAGNLGVLSPRRAERTINSPAGREEIQRRSEREEYIRMVREPHPEDDFEGTWSYPNGINRDYGPIQGFHGTTVEDDDPRTWLARDEKAAMNAAAAHKGKDKR